jgi:DNA invertase Pin-like site-specific DNA recombinase
MTATKAILYAAKSTEDKHGSIPTQLEDCYELAEREGWEVVGQFTDEGFSAYSGNRGPDLERAKALAARVAQERGGICFLVAQHSDRLARGAGDKPGAADSLVEIWHAMRRQNVHLRSVQNDAMLSDPLLVAAASKLAHEESQRKSEAVRAGMKRTREAGKWTGGSPAFGLEVRDGELVPMKSRIPIVKRMFAEYVAGRSQLAITRGLVADGVPTAKGGDWHQGTVRSILANPAYVKLGMIDQETWDKAEAMRKSRARTYGRGRPPAGQHLFRKGMLRCQCGEAMVPRTDGPREVYRCYGRHRDFDSCSMAPIPRELIDSAVYSYFESVGLDVKETRQQLADSREAKLAEVSALLEQAQRAERQAVEAHERIRSDYKRGALPADEWRDEWKPELEEELAATSAEVERLREQKSEVAGWGEVRDVEADTLRKLSDLRQAIAGEVQNAQGIEAVRAALSRLFEGFVLRNPGPVDGGVYGVYKRKDGSTYTAPIGFQRRSDETREVTTRDGRKVEVPAGSPSRNPEDFTPALDVGGYVIEVRPRPEVLEGYDEELTPILRREPLHQAENNYAEGFVR